MGIDFTSTAMVASVKRRAMLPNSQQLYPDSDIVRILTEELHADIVPLIMGVREDFFVHYYDQAIDTSVSEYALPVRAIGGKLRDVVLLNSDGKEVGIPRVGQDQVKNQFNSYEYQNLRGCGFFFKDDKVVLFPDSAAIGSFQLRMKYFRRPNNIILPSSAAKIAAIDTATKIITFSTIPGSFTNLLTYDFIKGTGGFRSLSDDVAPVLVNTAGKTMTLSSIPTGLEVNDYVAESGFSPIAQIPYEVHNLLEQRAVIKALEGIGDQEGMRSAGDVYKDMAEKFITLVTPRADGSPKRIVRSQRLFGGISPRNRWW